MRPFFSFYGSKWRISSSHYPQPAHGIVVEPFSGSAGYSVRHEKTICLLFEADPVIAGIWEYLIHVATPDAIACLPDVPDHASVSDLGIKDARAAHLVGMWVNKGCSSPRDKPSKWMRSGIRPGSFWGPGIKKRIALQLSKIKAWRIFNQSYECADEIIYNLIPKIEHENVSWFIDPPYQKKGVHYVFGSEGIDYDHLATWCRRRIGQVIVCEGEGASWLDFRTMGKFKTSRAGKRSGELIWTSER